MKRAATTANITRREGEIHRKRPERKGKKNVAEYTFLFGSPATAVTETPTGEVLT